MREQTWEERTKRKRWTSRMISRSRSVSSMAATAEARLKRGRRGVSIQLSYRRGDRQRRRQELRFRASPACWDAHMLIISKSLYNESMRHPRHKKAFVSPNLKKLLS